MAEMCFYRIQTLINNFNQIYDKIQKKKRKKEREKKNEYNFSFFISFIFGLLVWYAVVKFPRAANLYYTYRRFTGDSKNGRFNFYKGKNGLKTVFEEQLEESKGKEKVEVLVD